MEPLHKEKILILVKTYPTKSKKYVETVCTAGIREDGSWIRIFPVPFRKLNEYQKYKKYQWIECPVYKSQKDKRPESYHITDEKELVLKEIIQSSDRWKKRRKAILEKVRIFERKSDLLLASSNNSATLAVFKPKKVKFSYRKNKINESEHIPKAQLELFPNIEWGNDFKAVEELPYSFYYTITDIDGKTSKHKIIDWEIGALFFHQKNENGEKKALEAVINKYKNIFLDTEKYDLYLYLGTMLRNQQRRLKNPWIIIGVAPFLCGI